MLPSLNSMKLKRKSIEENSILRRQNPENQRSHVFVNVIFHIFGDVSERKGLRSGRDVKQY